MKTALASLALAFGLLGCAPGPQSATGFRLPDGNATQGKEVYNYIGCQTCHSLASEAAHQDVQDRMILGGEITRVKTYGDLVTSIINPSHKIAATVPESMKSESGTSLMEQANLNDRITVSELIDLVAFLQDQYEVVPPDVQPYLYYYK